MAYKTLAVHDVGLQQAERRSSSRPFGNPLAQLSWSENETLCCGLRGDRAELLRGLDRQGFLASLTKQGFPAPLEVVQSGSPDYASVLRLVRMPRVSYCHEWATLRRVLPKVDLLLAPQHSR